MADLVRVRHPTLCVYVCPPELRVSLGLPLAERTADMEGRVAYTAALGEGVHYDGGALVREVAGKVEYRSFGVWDYAPLNLLVAFDL